MGEAPETPPTRTLRRRTRSGTACSLRNLKRLRSQCKRETGDEGMGARKHIPSGVLKWFGIACLGGNFTPKANDISR